MTQQTPWTLAVLESTTTDDVKVLTNSQGAIVMKQADDILWLHPEQVEALKAVLKEF